jgi:hypothetical protein
VDDKKKIEFSNGFYLPQSGEDQVREDAEEPGRQGS